MRASHALVITLLAACTGSIDAGNAGDDTMEPPPTGVRVVVKDASSPVAGVRVIFQAADDTLIAETATDASGAAEAAMTAGNVSVIRTFPPVAGEPRRSPEVVTYVGVEAGDILELGKAEPVTPPTPSAIVVVVPELNGTVSVTTPCGSGQGEAPNVAITVVNCPAMLDVLLENNGSSGYMKVPYGPSVDVSSATLTEDLQSSISATNVPADASVEVDQRLYAGPFLLYAAGNRRVDQNPANVELPQLVGVDQLLVTRVNTNQRGTQMIGARSAYTGSTITVDASAHLIPYVMGPVEYAPTGISWLEAGAGTVDAVLVTLAVTRGAETGMPGPDAEYVRAIIAPHAGTQLRIPALPDAAFNPTSADSIGGALGLIAGGGYDAIRGRAFATESIVEAAPSGGAITLSYSGQAPGL